MAKMFYTMDEAKAALGRTEDEIKTLSREGKLREFRDGPRLMFKADQVEALKGSLGSRDTIDIADSGAPLSLVDSKSGTGAGGSVAGGSVAGGPVTLKDDTAAGEIGLSGSFGGVPSPRGGLQGSRAGSGVNIFNPDEVESADPSAATAITPSSERDNLEAVGSGSGLLDLTRESDDTSLGAVLDEIQPGKRDPNASKSGTAAGLTAAGSAALSAPPPVTVTRNAPLVVARPDPLAPLFGGLALGGAVLALFGIFLITSAVTGAQVTFLNSLAQQGLLIIAAIFLGVVLLCGAVGFGVGKVLR